MAATIAQALSFALSLAAFGLGLAVALGANNVVRRVAGLAIAHFGAAVLCAVLGATGLALAICASLAGTALLGGALAARFAEDHGGAETDAVNAADGAERSDAA